MANSADPEANWSGSTLCKAKWSGSTLFAKAGYIRVQQDKVNGVYIWHFQSEPVLNILKFKIL